ncbi:MAG: DUF6377 domain-containing protein [Janthinobacterium lividum]
MTVVRLFLLGSFLLLANARAAWATTRVDSLLSELNQALAHRQQYDAQRLSRIASLKTAYAASADAPATQFQLGLRIYDEYKAYKYDSAFAYCLRINRLADHLGDPGKVAVAKLKLAFILLSSGMFTETFDTLEHLDPRLLNPADRPDYYFLKARAYSDLGTFDQDDYYRPANYIRSLAYADTAAQCCLANSYNCLTVQGFIAQKHQDLPAGVRYYQAVQHLPGLTPHQLAVSASTLASLYELHSQEPAAFELLLLAAIADVKSATKETLAIFKVSDYCYRRGDLQNAYAFIREAREEAAFYKARQRQVELSHVSFVIEGQKINIIEQQRRVLRRNSWVLASLAVFGAGCALTILLQLRRLQRADKQVRAANQELRVAIGQLNQLNLGLNEANRVKDEYIGYYLNTNSQYIDKLEELKGTLQALLASKQYTGLQKLLDGVNIKQERNALFKGFDQVFLKLFPHFVAAFNTLFREEDRIHLADDQLLTTELRIFALVRLGIDDSERISRILGYSINTIYTYKTRVKSRSTFPNEEFEARVRALNAT